MRSDEMSLASSTAVVVIAGAALALSRFGGLSLTAPRAFTRLALVVVWGWIALSVAIWLLESLVRRRSLSRQGVRATLVSAGRAHLSLIGLGVVVFFASVALRTRWPGLLASIGVLGWWFPAALIGIPSMPDSWSRRVAIIAPAYAGWLLTVGRHLHQQLGHLV